MNAAINKSVCLLRCEKGDIHGIVKMTSLSKGTKFEVYIERIKQGYHGFHVHEFGDLRYGCGSSIRGTCNHYNPTGKNHGGRNDINAHLGDLGNLYAPSNGIIKEQFIAKYLTLHEIIGRSLIVHEDKDDLGKGFHKDSKTNGHSGKRILCGVIALSI